MDKLALWFLNKIFVVIWIQLEMNTLNFANVWVKENGFSMSEKWIQFTMPKI